MITQINICVVDHSSLIQDAKYSLADLGFKATLFVPNDKNAIRQVRGRTIDSVFLFGLYEADMDADLDASIKCAQINAKHNGFDCKFISLD